MEAWGCDRSISAYIRERSSSVASRRATYSEFKISGGVRDGGDLLGGRGVVRGHGSWRSKRDATERDVLIHRAGLRQVKRYGQSQRVQIGAGTRIADVAKNDKCQNINAHTTCGESHQ